MMILIILTTAVLIDVESVSYDHYLLQEHFFRVHPDARNLSYGDIADRVTLRQRLRCQPFSWYLAHVYPEQTLPDKHSPGAAVPALPANFKLNKQELHVVRTGRVRCTWQIW